MYCISRSGACMLLWQLGSIVHGAFQSDDATITVHGAAVAILCLVLLQAAMQTVTQPASKASQPASAQSKPKGATIALKNFAAVSRG